MQRTSVDFARQSVHLFDCCEFFNCIGEVGSWQENLIDKINSLIKRVFHLVEVLEFVLYLAHRVLYLHNVLFHCSSWRKLSSHLCNRAFINSGNDLSCDLLRDTLIWISAHLYKLLHESHVTLKHLHRLICTLESLLRKTTMF